MSRWAPIVALLAATAGEVWGQAGSSVARLGYVDLGLDATFSRVDPGLELELGTSWGDRLRVSVAGRVSCLGNQGHDTFLIVEHKGEAVGVFDRIVSCPLPSVHVAASYGFESGALWIRAGPEFGIALAEADAPNDRFSPSPVWSFLALLPFPWVGER